MYLHLVLGDTSSSEPVVPAVHGLVVHQHHLEVATLLTGERALCLLHPHLHSGAIIRK